MSNTSKANESFEVFPHQCELVSGSTALVPWVKLLIVAGTQNTPGVYRIAVYAVSYGDHVWNAMVPELRVQDHYDLSALLTHVRDYAPVFAREFPQALTFASWQKAQKFEEKHCRRPLNLRWPSDYIWPI